VVWFYQFLGQVPLPLGRLVLWKSGAIDSLMPEKTHVQLGFSEGCSLVKHLPTKAGGSGMRPRTTEVLPSVIHAKFSDP
jgi:hypothetical protein